MTSQAQPAAADNGEKEEKGMRLLWKAGYLLTGTRTEDPWEEALQPQMPTTAATTTDTPSSWAPRD